MYANAVRLMDRAVRTCGCPFPNYIAQHGSAVVVGPTRAGSPVQTKGSSSSFLRSTSSRTTNATWRNICGRAQLGLTVSCHRALHLYHHWLTWATLRLLCCVTDRSTVQQLAFGEEREEKMSTWQHAWSVAECIWTIMDRCDNGNTAKHRARAGLPCRHVLMIYPRHSTARH